MEIIKTNLQFNSNMTKRNLSNIKRIILHHTGETVLQSVERIHEIHKNSNGWAGIGYHFYVRKDGKIYEGRPLDCVGAHATNNNSDSIGICAEGNYEIEIMGDIQKNSTKELVASLKADKRFTINKVQKHGDVQATSCPGKNYPFDEIAGVPAKENNTTIENSTNDNQNKDIFNDGKINSIYDIQEWLNNNYGFNLALDNIYGQDTKKKLIMAYQTELNKQFNKGLVVDGIWGTNTYNASVEVSKGAQGNLTMILQMALFLKGYNLSMDKIFGSDTEVKVKEFQKSKGLAVDGIVGKNTFKELLN